MSNTKVQIEIFLGALFTVIASVFLIILGFQEQNALASSEEVQKAEAIEVGASIFVTNCAECHGEDAGGGKGPPLNNAYFFTQRLKDMGWGGTLKDYIISTVSGGRAVSTRPDQYPGGGLPAMPAWSSEYGGPLRPDQIRDVAEYILNFETVAIGEVPAPEFVQEPSLRLASPAFRGQANFISAGCIACHAIPGLSTAAVGPSLADLADRAGSQKEGYTAEQYIHESIVDPNAYVVEGFQENLMPQNFGERLSEDQINDIITFLLEQPWKGQ